MYIFTVLRFYQIRPAMSMLLKCPEIIGYAHKYVIYSYTVAYRLAQNWRKMAGPLCYCLSFRPNPDLFRSRQPSPEPILTGRHRQSVFVTVFVSSHISVSESPTLLPHAPAASSLTFGESARASSFRVVDYQYVYY